MKKSSYQKRLTRKLTDVIADVKQELRISHNITDKQIDSWHRRAVANGFKFPEGTHLVSINDVWIDYEVQRDVIAKHIITIMKNFDHRLCSPASSCRITNSENPEYIYIYDGQHRSVATAILGYNEVAMTIVDTDDAAFPSYAFEMLNEKGTKKLLPSDLHRNALTRYKLGSREHSNVLAYRMQEQFDTIGVDLEDKGTRNSDRRGDWDYFFSHFKYAQKAIQLDESGNTLRDILYAITNVFDKQEEVDQGVFIGLYELARINRHNQLPDSWMIEVLKKVKLTFNSSSLVHAKAKVQWDHTRPGATWSAPSAMANFLREVYIMNGGKMTIAYHGEGSLMQVTTNPAEGLLPRKAA